MAGAEQRQFALAEFQLVDILQPEETVVVGPLVRDRQTQQAELISVSVFVLLSLAVTSQEKDLAILGFCTELRLGCLTLGELPNGEPGLGETILCPLRFHDGVREIIELGSVFPMIALVLFRHGQYRDICRRVRPGGKIH